MSNKRKFSEYENEDLQQKRIFNKKHTLDSDEEDSDDYEKDNDSEVEGEEEGVSNIQDEVKITPFNMREELQEGHFDTEGHYHWNKDAEIKDNWLDNIDWVKVKTDKNYFEPDKKQDSNDSIDKQDIFNEALAYAQIINYMNPNETVEQALKRLDKGRLKLSSVERLRRKKLGIVDEAAEKITRFTQLTNEILTRTGNMDIYQETYAEIKNKLNNYPSTSKGIQSADASSDNSFDMYADNFAEKEKQHIDSNKEKTNETKELRWEYKLKQDDDEVHGPFTTEQMLTWSNGKFSKDGVYVRKIGESSAFYSSKRVDFDLYL
ncbi:CD2 antigen cytoplasmic tail-binding protein 2 homolog [Teleopsis dalmanni]|uniref:CD2 antigen cytoplasmic tail-binding protein 2 homolog n=1 Tax=Teleopsis dalmanni TaxID=139649 RepID=UPI0018CE835A|nr:CD2 antigen cytoplasmic tail-binding protein 2 homolog [Teleopsis dalmanni]